ncbi:MAG: amino acid-binding protein [Candidatus Thermoplasmatota archaeon]
MWDIVSPYFEKYPAKAKVAQILVSYGLRVDDRGNICCGKIKIPSSAIAKSLKVDKRTVDSTLEIIKKDPFLKKIFSRLQPICNLKSVASVIGGWDVLEIFVEDVHKPGLLAPIADLIAKEEISIRQVVIGVSEDSKEEPVYIITEQPIPQPTIRKIKEIDGVREVRHILL